MIGLLVEYPSGALNNLTRPPLVSKWATQPAVLSQPTSLFVRRQQLISITSGSNACLEESQTSRTDLGEGEGLIYLRRGGWRVPCDNPNPNPHNPIQLAPSIGLQRMQHKQITHADNNVGHVLIDQQNDTSIRCDICGTRFSRCDDVSYYRSRR